MGIVTRLLIPRGVRRAAHPVRTVRRAVTPRPIKQLRRTAYTITNPLGAIEGVFEDAVVDALRPRRRASTRRPPSAGTGADRYATAAAENDVFAAALSLHLVKVEAAAPTEPAPPPPLNERWVRRQLRANAVKGTSLFKRKERKAARATAEAVATYEIVGEQRRREALCDRQQQHLQEAFAALLKNDTSVTLAAAQAALAKLPLQCEAIACDPLQIDVLVTYPTLAVVPERDVKMTPTGRPSTRNRSQTERNDLYAEALASAALAATKVVMAALPAIPTARILIIVEDETRVDPVLLAVIARGGLPRADQTSALKSLAEAGSLALVRKGRTRKVMPLPENKLVAEMSSAERKGRQGRGGTRLTLTCSDKSRSTQLLTSSPESSSFDRLQSQRQQRTERQPDRRSTLQSHIRWHR